MPTAQSSQSGVPAVWKSEASLTQEDSKMAYEQVEMILKHVCQFHEKLGSIYGDLANRTNIEKSRMLLLSMSQHEQNRGSM